MKTVLIWSSRWPKWRELRPSWKVVWLRKNVYNITVNSKDEISRETVYRRHHLCFVYVISAMIRIWKALCLIHTIMNSNHPENCISLWYFSYIPTFQHVNVALTQAVNHSTYKFTVRYLRRNEKKKTAGENINENCQRFFTSRLWFFICYGRAENWVC